MSQDGAVIGAILGWTLRLAVIWFAFDLSRDAFADTSTPRRTAFRTVGWVLGLAALAGALKGFGSDEPCEPDPFGSGCSTYWETVSVSERISTAAFFLVGLGVPATLGAILGAGRRERRDPADLAYVAAVRARVNGTRELTWHEVRQSAEKLLLFVVILGVVGGGVLLMFVELVQRYGIWGFLIFAITMGVVGPVGAGLVLRVLDARRERARRLHDNLPPI